MHRATGGRHVARKSVVILDVARRQIARGLAFEFGEQLSRHLAERVDEHVEPAAVRHADHHFLDPLRAGTLHHFVHRGDKTFAAFERETLLADVFGVQEALQTFSRSQPLQDVFPLFDRERRR